MGTPDLPSEGGTEQRTSSSFQRISRRRLHAALLVGALGLGATATAAVADPLNQFPWTTSIAAPSPAVSAAEAPAAKATPTPSPAAKPKPKQAPEQTKKAAAQPKSVAPSTQANPAPTAPASAPAPVSNTHTIATGDTIHAVAARYGVNRDAMLAANGLTLYSPIYPGQVVKLTGPAIPLKVQEQPAPAAQAPTQQAPVPAPAPAAVPAAVPAGHTIYLSGAGGQEAVDRCAGPVHFTPIAESMSITEHDFCGGWARFSGIQVGETVTISGVGTYKVTGRGNVPKGGTMDHVRGVLGHTPPVFLQTCIPGTSMMLVIGLG